MNILSRYAFISNFNAEKLNKQDATREGVGSLVFSKCDKDGSGEISIEEILENSEVCSKILDSINGKIAETVKEIAELKVKEFKEGQLAKETEDKMSETKEPFVHKRDRKGKSRFFERFSKPETFEIQDFTKDIAEWIKPEKLFNFAA